MWGQQHALKVKEGTKHTKQDKKDYIWPRKLGVDEVDALTWLAYKWGAPSLFWLNSNAKLDYNPYSNQLDS